MVPNKMEVYAAPVNVWNKDAIRPGPVGTVGDVLLGVRLKQSAPELPQRWDPSFSGKNEVFSGSNVSDGYSPGFTTGGGVARTITRRMPYRQGFKTPVGWVMEDIVPTERSRTALMGSVGQYSWESKVGEIKRAKTTGEFFKPLPLGYGLADGVTPRGSNIPRIVAESTGEGNALPPTEIKITDPVFGENGSIPNPAANIVRVWDFPDLLQHTWIPEWVAKDGSTPIDTHYKFYVSGIGGFYKYFPKNDPTIEQEVYDRFHPKPEREYRKFSPYGLVDRPDVYLTPDGKKYVVGDPPSHYEYSDTGKGEPISKPGGWRGPLPPPFPQPPKPGEKEGKIPTKFMGVNSMRSRIR